MARQRSAKPCTAVRIRQAPHEAPVNTGAFCFKIPYVKMINYFFYSLYLLLHNQIFLDVYEAYCNSVSFVFLFL